MPKKAQVQRFSSVLIGRGPKGAWVFLPIPFDVHDAFGTRARVAVEGTLNGAPFRLSLLPNGDGTHAMPVSKELQSRSGAGAGDQVAVVLRLDTAPRSVDVPDDLAAALAGRKGLAKLFAALAYSHQKEYVEWITAAKKDATRAGRIAKALGMIEAGQRLKG